MSELNSSIRLLHFESRLEGVDLMKSSLPLVKPIALMRPRGAHRFETFSPKLQRRTTFCRRFLLEFWVLLETDPAVQDAVFDALSPGERGHDINAAGERTGQAVIIDLDHVVGGTLAGGGVVLEHVEMAREE